MDTIGADRLVMKLVLLVCLVDNVVTTTTVSPNRTRAEILNDLLVGYDARISPNFNSDGPITSEVQIYISDMASISDSTMDYSMSMFLRQRWTDPRLAFNPLPGNRSLELDVKLMEGMWVPDLYVLNEKKAIFHEITIPNKLMHIYSNGLVFYSLRISGTFSCDMNLYKYPMDYQICDLTMESYGQSTENLLLRWHNIPVIRPDSLTLPQFELGKIETFVCDKEYSGINYTCISMKIHLIRNYGYHVTQIFIPSALIVCLSWVSFWLNIDSTPARISLGLLTVLTMTTQSSGARANLPKVSYIKAIDVWMAVCLFFVFAALIEFAWVNVLSRVQKRRQEVYQADGKNGNTNSNKHDSETTPEQDKLCCCIKTTSDREKARLVDKGARILFPLAFLAFNLVYWLFYILWEPVRGKSS